MDAVGLNDKIALAAEQVPQVIDNCIKGNQDAASEQMTALLGTTYADILALLLALCEYAADEAGLPDPDPDHHYSIRIRGANGEILDPEQDKPDRVWSTRFLAAVWGGDHERVIDLYQVFMEQMTLDDQQQVIGTLLTGCAQTVYVARLRKEGRA